MTEMSPAADLATRSGSDLDAFESLLDSWRSKPSLAGSCAAPPSEETASPGERNESLDEAQARGMATNVSVRELVEMVTTNSRLVAGKLDDAREQMALLERELEQSRRAERKAAVEVLRALVDAFEIKLDELTMVVNRPTPADEGLANSCGVEKAAEHAPDAGSYIGPNGEIWLGRGRHPAWLKQALQAGGSLPDLWRSSGHRPRESVEQMALVEG